MITTYANLDELPANISICIYGLGGRGQLIKNILLETRKDITIVCFIDDYKKESATKIPTFSSDEFLQQKLNFDSIILASIHYGKLYEKVGHLNCMLVGLPFFIRETDKFSQQEIDMYQDKISLFKKNLNVQDLVLYNAILDARLNENHLQ